jgi:quercetin dioxygenase-like cupin family protein
MESYVSFPSPEEVGPRDWGTEMLILEIPGLLNMKMITMEKGKRGGYQYHRIKNEGGLMISGSMEIVYKDKDTGKRVSRIVRRGDAFHFPPHARHQAIAHTDCCYIEVSNPIFNDRVHAEHEIGIEKEEGGLPSTKPWEIERR